MSPDADIQQAQRVHMVGVGGSGMAALASLLLQMGKHVSGSDASRSAVTERLARAGATVHEGHSRANLGLAEYVVRSSAISSQNPEVREAERLGLPNRKLAESVGELMRGRSGIAIAGTHGKTTTTALVTWLLEQGGVDPLALIGADTPAFPFGARLGEGPMVVEADEYDRRFLNYWPEAAIVTNVEADHLDYFRDLAEIREAFQDLVERLPEFGNFVVCADDACAVSLETRARRETYGFAADAHWRVDDYVAAAGRGSRFTLRNAGRAWRVDSSLSGEHNARNVAGAIALAEFFGVGLSAALTAVSSFEGPRRRFETKGRPGGVWIVDDYGHHPTEVTAVLRTAARLAEGEVWVVFQPHTSHRTAALLNAFASSFGEAHHALILPIYRPSGREANERAIEASDLVEAVRTQGHPDARAIESFDDAVRAVTAGAKPGDLVVTMGAGDVTLLSDRLVEALSP